MQTVAKRVILFLLLQMERIKWERVGTVKETGHKTKIILAMGKRASNLKLFKESVKIVGPQALENSRTFLTLNESLFSMIFSLDLNGISPQTISNSKTPSDQVAADLNRMLMVCSI